MNVFPSRDQHTPAFKIFHYYIDVVLPASYAYENKYIREGMPIIKDKNEMAEHLSEPVRCKKTVNEMIELYKRGCQITFVKPEDTVKVYEWLNEHLLDVRTRVGNTMQTNKIPLDDLMVMDEFARIIHTTARRYSTSDLTDAKINRSLDDLMASRGLLKDGTHKPETQRSKREFKNHVSPMPDIARLAIERNLHKDGK